MSLRVTLGRAVLALAASFALSGVSSAATFTDTTFAGWTTVNLFGPANGQASAQIGTGGNPGSALSVTTATGATTYTGHLSNGLTYNFSQGAILSVDVMLDYNPVSARGDGHAVYPLLVEQGGTYFGATYQLTGSTSGWDTFSLTDLTAADFVKFDGTTAGTAGSPDFSDGAAPITFGFITANSGGAGINVRYDNFKVVLTTTTPVPLPASLPLLAVGLSGLVLRRLI